MNKKTISSLSLILILAVSMIMVFAQPTLAQVGVPQPEESVAYVTVSPTLVGVGQPATVNLWFYPIPTTYLYSSWYIGYFGVTVTFVKPDGTKDTFMPTDATGMYQAGETQALGAIFFFYKPDMAGNWSVTCSMPAQNITDTTTAGGTRTVLVQGATSKSFYFTVQTDPVLAGLLNGYPWAPLPNPNVFWSYPINTNNREWYQIAGDWIASSRTKGRWQPYGTGPNTGHVLWKQQVRRGGIIGGDYGTYSFVSTNIGAQIMMGRVYLNIPNTSPAEYMCIDEATGQILYRTNGSISSGLHISSTAYTQASSTNLVCLEGSYGNNYTPYLYMSTTLPGNGTVWNLIDPLTGEVLRQIFNCSSTTLVDGSWIAYGYSGGNVYRWNYSMVPTTGTGANNWSRGIEYQKPINLTTYFGSAPASMGISDDQSTIVFRSRNQFWGYSTATGALLWNMNITYALTSNEELQLANTNDFILWDQTASTWHCYSMLTGNQLWESDPCVVSSDQSTWWAGTWTVYTSYTNDNNNFYVTLSDGTCAAYSLADGHQVWRSTAIPSTEYTNNAVPNVEGEVLVGGNLYCYAGYSISYQLNPLPRFNMLVCINATTGDRTFALPGGIFPTAAANGYVIGTSLSDGYQYCIGKGKTSTTVTAQQQVGGSVLIQGSVMDMSPASPNTPAISDADMSQWMDYLQFQNATLLNSPPNCKGVPVTLTAVSSSGTNVNLGTVTSDVSGHFASQWTPTTEGLYTVYATFAGSNSYFSSYAETAATVAIAAATPATPAPPETQPDNTNLLYGILVAVIIAIVLALIAIVRKK